MKAGVYFGVSFDEYRSWDGWSSSDLKALRQGPPSLVPWRRANPSAETDATRLGTVSHAAIIEGDDVFASRFAFKPEDMTFSTKEGKAWKAAQGGRTIVTFKEAEVVREIATAFFAKGAAAMALDSALAREACLVWSEDGILCKARPDWYSAEAVDDLKITRFATERGGAFHGWCDGWFHQLAFYRRGLRACGIPVNRGRNVLIHPAEPHAVYLLEPKPDVLDLLDLENMAGLKRLAKYAESGVWPGTPDEWALCDLPAAALVDIAPMVGMENEDG